MHITHSCLLLMSLSCSKRKVEGSLLHSELGIKQLLIDNLLPAVVHNVINVIESKVAKCHLVCKTHGISIKFACIQCKI